MLFYAEISAVHDDIKCALINVWHTDCDVFIQCKILTHPVSLQYCNDYYVVQHTLYLHVVDGISGQLCFYVNTLTFVVILSCRQMTSMCIIMQWCIIFPSQVPDVMAELASK